MFPPRYFAPKYFAPKYFPPGLAVFIGVVMYAQQVSNLSLVAKVLESLVLIDTKEGGCTLIQEESSDIILYDSSNS